MTTTKASLVDYPADMSERQKITVTLPSETVAQLRALLMHVPPAAHGYRNLSDIVSDALSDKITTLQGQHNHGQPWPEVGPGAIPTGYSGHRTADTAQGERDT